MRSQRANIEQRAYEKEQEFYRQKEREQEAKIQDAIRIQKSYDDNTKYLRDEIQSLKRILAALIISKHEGQVVLYRVALDHLRNQDCRISYCDDKANRCLVITVENT